MTTETFDPVLAALAQRIKAAVKAYTEAGQNAVQRAIEAGKVLNEAKAKFKHGEWGKWLKEQCDTPERTARRCMRLAANQAELEEKLKTKSATLADLTIVGAEELLGTEPEAGTTSTGSGTTGSGSSSAGSGSNPAAAYDKAEEKLIKKLQDLDPKEVADHAEATIKKLRETVAIMTKALKKAA